MFNPFAPKLQKENTSGIPALTLICAMCVAATSIYAIVNGPATRKLNDMPQAIVSFGAAVIGDEVYVYSGHIGRAHQHSMDNLSKGFYRLNILKDNAWEKIGDVRPLQGLAMVAHQGKLYRIGGLEAKNAKDEPGDLWSTNEVACYDPKTKKWSTCTPLPESRSSHDAVVVGDRVYVVGGWKLAGEGVEGDWHTTVYSADLTKQTLKWERLPDLPYRIRANSLAGVGNTLVAIGGIKPTGKTSNDVAIFDIASKKWAKGPDYPGEKPMRAFGSSAFASGGLVYASAWDGKVYVLGKNGKAWQPLDAQLAVERFFHRLVAYGDNGLLFLGGASREGHSPAVEWLEPRKLTIVE